jgi:hypothetical protein
MRWPRPRFSVRWLMAAVAVVASVIGAESMLRVRAHRLEKVRWFTMSERAQRDKAREVAAAIAQGRRDLGGVVEMALYQADRYAQLRRKWETAAAHFWASEPPDPPLLPRPELPPTPNPSGPK